jgi:hypothetical protein
MGSHGGAVNATPDLIARSLDSAVSYDEYFARLGTVVDGGEMYQNEKQNFYTKLNHQRMKRLNGRVKLADDVVESASRIDCDIRLPAISEGWCGDAAQVLPVLNLLVNRFDTLELGIVYRDEHPKMDYGTYQKELQKWYLRDRAEQIQTELAGMLEGCRG